MYYAAYLIGISNYPGHALAGVPNDLALIQRALIHQGFDLSTIYTFGDDHATRTGLCDILAVIRNDFADVDSGSCFVYFSSSGMLSLDPLLGGVKPIDGDELDFRTALPFAALNDYLPVRRGIHVTVVLDC